MQVFLAYVSKFPKARESTHNKIFGRGTPSIQLRLDTVSPHRHEGYFQPTHLIEFFNPSIINKNKAITKCANGFDQF